MAASGSRSIWPLAGYAALAAVAFARRRVHSGRYVHANMVPLHRPREATQPDETKATETPIVDRSWWGLVKNAGMQWVGHKDSRLGAALAYYSVFSIGPLIVIAVAIAGLLFGQEAVRGEVSNTLRGLLGDTGAQAINAMLAGASKPHEGIIATVIGIGTLIF